MSNDFNSRPRFYGIYRGTIVHASDPTNKYRVKVIVPQVFGTAQTSWADPCLPVTHLVTHVNHSGTLGTTSSGDPAHTHGVSINLAHSDHEYIPKVGQQVWIMFEGGDPDFPVWIGIKP